jgi:hypothetical protein
MLTGGNTLTWDNKRNRVGPLRRDNNRSFGKDFLRSAVIGQPPGGPIRQAAIPRSDFRVTHAWFSLGHVPRLLIGST